MPRARFERHFHTRLIDGLYADAMMLAEAARSYFDGIGRDERDRLNALQRVSFSCESLKVTTRLMHVLAWVLTQRAVEAGEMDVDEAKQPERRLGQSPESDALQVGHLPRRARRLCQASQDLYRRVERLDLAEDTALPMVSPVQMLQARLNHAF